MTPNQLLRTIIFFISIILGLWATYNMIILGISSLILLGATWSIIWSVIKALLMMIGAPIIGILIMAIGADINWRLL